MNQIIMIDFWGPIVLLAILWFLDEILTKLDLNKYGKKAERNLWMRKLIKKGPAYVISYKIISFASIVVLSSYMYWISKEFYYGFIGILLVLYFIVDANNWELLKKKKK